MEHGRECLPCPPAPGRLTHAYFSIPLPGNKTRVHLHTIALGLLLPTNPWHWIFTSRPASTPLLNLGIPRPVEQPLRIQIEGPLVSIEKLLPGVRWQLDDPPRLPLQPAGPELARAAFHTIYGQDIRPDVEGDMVMRDEYLGWVMEGPRPWTKIDYYGVTFDHIVPPGDADPEILQINIIEMDDDGGAYADEHLPISVDPAEYTGRKVLAVPRCYQKRKGTQDRTRINESVTRRDELMRELNEGSLTRGAYEHLATVGEVNAAGGNR